MNESSSVKLAETERLPLARESWRSIQQETLAEADRCVLCGLCLPHCPTYRKTGDENESPRGRVVLIRALAGGALPVSARLASHLSLCLGCRACERVCPSGVHYGALIEAGRSLLHGNRKTKFSKQMGLVLVARPRLLEMLGVVLRSYQRSGLQRLVRASGLLRRLRRDHLESLLPVMTPALPREKFYPAQGSRRGQVALFLGCIARVVDTGTLAAAIRVLTRFGFDVLLPAHQTCCGALHREDGQTVTAEHLRHANIAGFEACGVDTVITVASGCGAVLAEIEKPAGASRLRILDIHQFLAETDLPETVSLAPLSVTVAVQDACSLRNVLRAEQSVPALLTRIPGVRCVALNENNLCCGGAGSYPLRQPAMANELRADKLAHLQRLAPDIAVTANIGCALHLQAGLAAQGSRLEILHPIVFFERQLRSAST